MRCVADQREARRDIAPGEFSAQRKRGARSRRGDRAEAKIERGPQFRAKRGVVQRKHAPGFRVRHRPDDGTAPIGSGNNAIVPPARNAAMRRIMHAAPVATWATMARWRNCDRVSRWRACRANSESRAVGRNTRRAAMCCRRRASMRGRRVRRYPLQSPRADSAVRSARGSAAVATAHVESGVLDDVSERGVALIRRSEHEFARCERVPDVHARVGARCAAPPWSPRHRDAPAIADDEGASATTRRSTSSSARHGSAHAALLRRHRNLRAREMPAPAPHRPCQRRQ